VIDAVTSADVELGQQKGRQDRDAAHYEGDHVDRCQPIPPLTALNVPGRPRNVVLTLPGLELILIFPSRHRRR
jgi:hypothetical protein